MTAVERALAQERTYKQASADPVQMRAATAADGRVPTALLAGSIAGGLLLAAVGGLAAIAVHRRHVREAAVDRDRAGVHGAELIGGPSRSNRAQQ